MEVLGQEAGQDYGGNAQTGYRKKSTQHFYCLGPRLLHSTASSTAMVLRHSAVGIEDFESLFLHDLYCYNRLSESASTCSTVFLFGTVPLSGRASHYSRVH
jgi:hypothetical protein